MQPSPIACDRLTKRFGSLIALESVTFTVNEPSVIVLVGPNGSGKSTLLRLLMGALRPSDGAVILHGRPPRSSNGEKVPVGYLSAADRMFPELSVLENMVYRGVLHGLSFKDSSSTSCRLLRERGLYKLRDRRPNQLSTGQRRQICLLSTLMAQPKILLLDEPTTGIDIMAITQIYRLMEELCDDDCTIILATHHIEELIALCDRTLALHDGQLIKDCSTKSLGATRNEVRDSLRYLFLGQQPGHGDNQPVPVSQYPVLGTANASVSNDEPALSLLGDAS